MTNTPPSNHASGPENAPANERDEPTGGDPVAPSAPWPKLRRSELAAMAALATVLTVFALPQLPPGVCFGDPGDIQLASATLGIMHPPGYAGYTTIGYFLTLIPAVDPAYVISLACLTIGIVGLVLCQLLQMRLGVNAWLAGALCLALASHHRIWINLVAPEVYAPSLALLAGAMYLLVRFGRRGRRIDLWAATLMYGMTLANRPSVVWMLPFFVGAWWLIERRRRPSGRAWINTTSLVVLFGVLPTLYSLTYLWVRDRPDIQYNYIDHHNAEFHELPQAADGIGAKVERIIWQASAQEFSWYMHYTLRGVRSRLGWLHAEFFLYRMVDFMGTSLVAGPYLFPIVLVLLLCGGAIAYRRCAEAFWLLVGLIIGNMAFVCTYKIYGLAADLSAMMLAVTILVGVALSRVMPDRGRVRSQAAAVLCFGAMVLITWIDAPYRQEHPGPSAIEYLSDLDMATLPRGAVICSTWRQSPPLWYAQHVLTHRDDITVVNTTTSRWAGRLADYPDRPLFSVAVSHWLEGFDATPYNNIWRLVRTTSDESP